VNIDKYKTMANNYDIKDILLISPEQIVFDVRAFLKCRWGCSFSKNKSIKCDTHNTSIDERKQIINSYRNILLLHNNNAKVLTHACLDIERELYLDGYYFAFTLRSCNFCTNCNADKGKDCSHPEKVRPCEEMFGIDVFKTIRNLGLPINVLISKEETENRYGFVLID
jgi:predicted metal-binding protein